MTNEQLTELARQYAQDRYCSETNETPKYKIAQIHAGRDGFIKGAKYMRNSPRHTDEEPFYERKGKRYLYLLIKMGSLNMPKLKILKNLYIPIFTQRADLVLNTLISKNFYQWRNDYEQTTTRIRICKITRLVSVTFEYKTRILRSRMG